MPLVHERAHGVRRAVPCRRVAAGRVPHVHGEGAALRGDDRGLQVRGRLLRVHRGAHRGHQEARPPFARRAHHAEREVREDAPLVELVEQHAPHAAQRRVALRLA
ncbi:MAG: hypothetical protein ACKOQW_02240 [Phycisphaerales bacterium]